jgi:hypothetical protein
MIKEQETRYPLNEKLYRIQSDVDLIYDKFFKDLIKEVQKTGKIKEISKYIKNEVINPDYHFSDICLGTLSSRELISIDGKKANKELEIEIYCGVFKIGSLFSFGKKYVLISLNNDIINMIQSSVYTIDSLSSDSLKRRARNELTEQRVKASIAHELSHYIDEASKLVFTRIIKDCVGITASEKLLLKNKNVNMTYFEIQGQVHGIQQIKRKFKNKFDVLTLNDLFELYPPLSSIAISLFKIYGTDILKIWLNQLLRRMGREKLVGKNMRKFNVNKLMEKESLKV